MEYYSVINKNELRPFAATWTDQEHVILSKEKKYDNPYMWNLKRNDTNELTLKKERDSQT